MSLIRKLRDRLQGATLHDLWVETRWVLHHSKRYRRSIAAYVLLGIASIALSLLSSLSSRELINAIVYLQGGGRRVLLRRHRRAAGRLDHRAQCSCQPFQGTGAPPHFPELSLRGGAADVAISQCPLG